MTISKKPHLRRCAASFSTAAFALTPILSRWERAGRGLIPQGLRAWHLGLFGDRQGGFSLVEVILSLALTGMVMAMTLPFVQVQKRLWERQDAERESGRALTGAMAWISRDLQQAGYHVPGQPLRRLEATALAYVLSRDEDDPAAFSSQNRRLITVYLDQRDLKYRIQAPLNPPDLGWESGSTQILASGISAMRCRGFDRSGAETAAPEAVALVACEMTAGSTVLGTAVRVGAAGLGYMP